MKSLKLGLISWALRLDAMSFRERVLVCVASAGLLATVLFVGLVEPQLKRETLNQQIEDGLRQEILTQREQLNQAKQASKDGRNTELGRIEARVAQLEHTVRARQAAFVEPERMLGQLREMLAQQAAVELLDLRVADAQPVTLETEGESTAGPALFYRHPTTVRLRGSYDALTQALLRLEGLSGAVKWTLVRVDARHHPKLEMTVQFDSLSQEGVWARL